MKKIRRITMKPGQIIGHRHYPDFRARVLSITDPRSDDRRNNAIFAHIKIFRGTRGNKEDREAYVRTYSRRDYVILMDNSTGKLPKAKPIDVKGASAYMDQFSGDLPKRYRPEEKK